MKINQGPIFTKDKSILPKDAKPSGASPFQQILTDNRRNLAKEHLSALIADIEKQGEKLIRSRMIKDLKAYKSMITAFLREVVSQGYALEESISFSPMGNRERRLKMIKEVNAHLLELTAEVLEKEDQHISLLDKIGEIKGLLIDLQL